MKRLLVIPLTLSLTLLGGLAACGETPNRKIDGPAPSTEQQAPPTSSSSHDRSDGVIVDSHGLYIADYVCESNGSATYINDKTSLHVDASKFCPKK